MPVHHLNCATMRPPLVPTLVAHVLLVERPAGLLLVDTGFGTADLADFRRLGPGFARVCKLDPDPAQTALAQVEALGFAPGDVTDIALTHLDLDHAGGISDFPHARVHVFARELEAATHPTLRERNRYVAAQWAHGPQWVQHDEPGDPWFGFPAVAAIDDDVLLVPLPGHTRGHCGVAVRDGDRWLLHAGDSFFAGGQVEAPASCPRGLAAFQVLMAVDNGLRKQNLERLRELVAGHSAEVTTFCAHDAAQFERLSGTTVG